LNYLNNQIFTISSKAFCKQYYLFWNIKASFWNCF